MAEDFKVGTAPAVDAAAAEAASAGGGAGGGAGGPEFFSSGGLPRGAGVPPPSFTVVAADMKNSGFKVLRPYVYVAGRGEVAVGGKTSGYGFGDTVYCIVEREASGSGYAYSARLSDESDDGAYLCVKVAEIPARTMMLACGGVLQFHSGSIFIAGGGNDLAAGDDTNVVFRECTDEDDPRFGKTLVDVYYV